MADANWKTLPLDRLKDSHETVKNYEATALKLSAAQGRKWGFMSFILLTPAAISVAVTAGPVLAGAMLAGGVLVATVIGISQGITSTGYVSLHSDRKQIEAAITIETGRNVLQTLNNLMQQFERSSDKAKSLGHNECPNHGPAANGQGKGPVP